jgi:hypothetical protein
VEVGVQVQARAKAGKGDEMMGQRGGPPGYPPPAGGFGGEPPAFGAPQAFVAPPPRQAQAQAQAPLDEVQRVFVPLRKVTRLLALIVGTPCLVAVVYAIVTFEREKKRDLVVFDNRLDAPAEVLVDGKPIESIEPHRDRGRHPVVTLPEGAKKIVVMSKGAVVSSVELAIRPRAKDEAHGYRGLYVIGPSTDYVIAKVPYYADEPDKPELPRLVSLRRPEPLTELPRELDSFEMKVDSSFLKSESMMKGTKMVWKTQLCTIDSSTTPTTVGCAGFPSRGFVRE